MTDSPDGGPPSMDPTEYMTQRLEDQIRWYDEKSQIAKRWFRGMRGVEIVCAAAVPVLAGHAADSRITALLIALLGALVVVLAALVSLGQHQENWVSYRATCEALKHERCLYLTRAKPYDGDDPFHLLVTTVESLVSKEHGAWTERARQAAEKSKPRSEHGG